MGAIAEVAATPLTLELSNVTYEMAPLDMSDIGRIEIYIQYREYQNLSKGEASEELLDRVFKKCSETPVEFGDKTFSQCCLYPDVLLELIHASIKHNHPDVTKATLARQLDMKEVSRLVDRIASISGWTDDGDSAKNVQGAGLDTVTPN